MLLDEIAQRLADQSIASSSGGTWLVIKSFMPDSTALQDKIVAIVETGGSPPEGQPKLHRATFQVRVRGASINAQSSAYEEAREKIEQVYQDLYGIGGQSLSGTHYVGIWPEQSPFLLQYDETQRPELVVNFRAMRTTT